MSNNPKRDKLAAAIARGIKIATAPCKHRWQIIINGKVTCAVCNHVFGGAK